MPLEAEVVDEAKKCHCSIRCPAPPGKAAGRVKVNIVPHWNLPFTRPRLLQAF